MCLTLKYFVLFSVSITVSLCGCLPSPYRNCPDVFNPQNYLEHLPSLALPYRSNMVIPSPYIPMIKPTPTMTTKVINIVTKYVSKNPVCIKVSGRKPPCKAKKSSSKSNHEHIITKEYFVYDRKPNNTHSNRRNKLLSRADLDDINNQHLEVQLESSEEAKAVEPSRRTPQLSHSKIQELLIEDRLDHLEQILPSYTRRRYFKTSTVTVTRTRSDLRPMATLMVKNCIPEGYDYCSPKRRKSKSSEGNDDDEDND